MNSSDADMISSDSSESSAASASVAKQSSPTEELLAKMEALLAEGAKAVQRHDEFLRENNLPLGIGEEMLLSPHVAPEHQQILRRLLDEYAYLPTRIKDTAASLKAATAAPSVTARALGHRYRI